MARHDLETLREAIVSLAGLTESEARVIKYWGEERLLETFALLPEEDEQYDDGGYFDEPFYEWEIEITFDYGDD
jgi:hypothetical protein